MLRRNRPGLIGWRLRRELGKKSLMLRKRLAMKNWRLRPRERKTLLRRKRLRDLLN